jgi:hypothetical protein
MFSKILLILLFVCLTIIIAWLFFKGLKLLFSYRLTDNSVQVVFLKLFPIWQIRFDNIKQIEIVSFGMAALVPAIHMFTKPFADRVALYYKKGWFIGLYITPDNPSKFVRELEIKMTNLRN